MYDPKNPIPDWNGVATRIKSNVVIPVIFATDAGGL